MAALSSRLCFASVPMVVSRSWTMDKSRGDLKVYAAKKKSKRSQERKAQRKAENKEIMSSGKKSGEEEEDVGEAAVKGPAPYESTAAVMQSLTICGSYKSQTDEKLLDGKENPIQPAVPNPFLTKQWTHPALWNAPFVCASHDADDVFNYANKAACELWGLSFDEFVGMPSTKSADESDAKIQEERRSLLDKAEASGVIRDYSGIRVTSEGRRFKVNGATVWTINDRDGNKTGQAVRFDSFTWMDSEEEMTVTTGGEIVPKKGSADAETGAEEAEAKEAHSAAELEAAKVAVEEQATKVRRLKEEENLSNSDKEVQEAVSELLERKNTLAALVDKAR